MNEFSCFLVRVCMTKGIKFPSV